MTRRTRGIGDKWIDVCRRLNASGVEYVVVGSVAMALHGEVRATKDIDVLVPRDLDNMKRLLDALGELPMGLARELDAATEVRKAITVIGDDPRVDVLKGAGGLAYGAAKKSKRTARIRGVEIPYVGLRELIQSKDTGRDQDQVDQKKLTRLLEARARARTRTTSS